jgi:ATP-dependent RNA helicase RhlE
MVDRERKRELLSHLITSGRIEQALVFTRTKHGANRLAQQLERDGIAATAIHGNKSQPQRVRALADFKAGMFTALVATEVAARGLDIEALPHVVNFELPMVPEDYVHRIGRTGRAGVDGDAVSLVCVDELGLLADVERVLGRPIPRETIAGFEPDPRIRPEPILRGGLGSSRPSGRSSAGPRHGVAASRHAGARRPDGGRRPGGHRSPTTSPRPGDRHATPATVQGGQARGGEPSRPIGTEPSSRSRQGGHQGAPFSGPRRPGQGIGNGISARPGRPGPRHGKRPAGAHPRPQHGGPRPDRPAGPGYAMPGERLSRNGDRPAR